jgi:sulfate transport system substrate-binding protein
MQKKNLPKVILLILALALALPVGALQAQDDTVTITFAGFAVPREAYAELIPVFQAQWEAETGQKVEFEESYQASGAQSRAIIGGFEADIAALSLEAHITAIEEAGLITHDWKAEYNGTISTSVAVLAVRPGNPENIEDWVDIGREGIEVITPDPATSGGAQWNILAAYGAASRGFVEGYEATPEAGEDFLRLVINNVLVFDKDGRESYLTFESGIGDVAITYENEIFAARQAGGEVEVVYPASTILIENPIALIDENVDKHGNREAAEAFIAFLRTPEAQAIYAGHGFRSILPEVNAEFEDQFPVLEDQFTILDLFEAQGWPYVSQEIFGTDGRFTLLIAEVKGQ